MLATMEINPPRPGFATMERVWICYGCHESLAGESDRDGTRSAAPNFELVMLDTKRDGMTTFGVSNRTRLRGGRPRGKKPGFRGAHAVPIFVYCPGCQRGQICD